MHTTIELYLVPVLGRCQETNREDEFRFCCPRCPKEGKSPDKDFHLYVNPYKEKYICHRCGWKGSTDYLLKYLGVKDFVAMDTSVPWEETLQRLLNGEQATPSTQPDAEPTLPDDYVPLYPGTEAYNYVVGRGFSPAMIEARKVGFGIQKHKGLIVFPEYSGNNLLYWSARPYVSWRRRAFNCPVEKNEYIYWLEQVPDRRFVFVTEGVFDAIIFGDWGVALLGNKITKDQLELLLSKNFEIYYLALDADTMVLDKKGRATQLKLAHELWQRGKSVKVLQFPVGEDPNSIGVERIGNYIAAAHDYHPDNVCGILLS